jgi:DNA-directed RNA polymerase subunit RPC12/RpoP
MDIIFNCPKCEQELAVDSAGVGSEIECPSCGESIVIPTPATPGVRMSQSTATFSEVHPVNAIASSAAAKIERHLKVPVRATPTESLITKPLVPLEVAAKESDKKVRVKTIKHSDCLEVGRDKFDEFASNFLAKIGDSNLISISPLNYSHLDIETQKVVTDFAILIVYKG